MTRLRVEPTSCDQGSVKVMPSFLAQCQTYVKRKNQDDNLEKVEAITLRLKSLWL